MHTQYAVYMSVALYMSAWIEILAALEFFLVHRVALYMSAWIEIANRYDGLRGTKSHST